MWDRGFCGRWVDRRGSRHVRGVRTWARVCVGGRWGPTFDSAICHVENQHGHQAMWTCEQEIGVYSPSSKCHSPPFPPSTPSREQKPSPEIPWEEWR